MVFTPDSDIHKLKPGQRDELHRWLARGIPYPELEKLMLQSWEFTISSQDCSYHRRTYAAKIQDLYEQEMKQEEKRTQNRLTRRLRRQGMKPKGIHGDTCPCCRCYPLRLSYGA